MSRPINSVSESTVRRVKELTGRGDSWATVATLLRISENTISRILKGDYDHLLPAGTDSARNTPEVQEKLITHTWTPGQIRKLTALRRGGMCYERIAQELRLEVSLVRAMIQANVRLEHGGFAGSTTVRGRCPGCGCDVTLPCVSCTCDRLKDRFPSPTPLPEGLDEETREMLTTPLAELQMPLRIVNALESAGMLVVHDLLHRTEADLLQIVNVGDKAIQSIYAALEKHHPSLRKR